jgi:DNA relaxase NicK
MWLGASVLVDCGIDWFTTTALDPPTSKLLTLKAEGMMLSESAKGFYIKPWSMKGYSGWRCGRVEWGERQDGVVARLSGGLAASDWWTLWQITERCSRIDLQATFRLVHKPFAEIQHMRRVAQNFYDGRSDGPKITFWSDNKKGACLYFGSRASSLYFRAYNKEAESGRKEFEGCVRLELEVKNRLTYPTVQRLLAAETTQHGILSELATYMDRHGLSPNFGTVDLHSRSECSIIQPDCQKSLDWLSSAVKPTVQRLVAMGLTEEVFEAIGLPKSV